MCWLGKLHSTRGGHMNRTLKIGIAALGSLVLMVVGAVAYAGFPTTDGVVSSCVTKPGGVIRIIDAETQSCKKGEVPLAWNQQGVPGVSGYEKVVSTRTFDPGVGAVFAVGN